MNHRQHKAIWSAKLLWITKEPEGIRLLSNKYISSRGWDFYACISSWITTVIQVVKYHQINDNWFNEPFAVSLYILLILRQAWHNLWDKYMTTGRINQVTILSFHRCSTKVSSIYKKAHYSIIFFFPKKSKNKEVWFFFSNKANDFSSVFKKKQCKFHPKKNQLNIYIYMYIYR